MKIGDKVVVKKEGASHSNFIRGEVVEITSIGHSLWGDGGFYATNGKIEQILFTDQVEIYKEEES